MRKLSLAGLMCLFLLCCIPLPLHAEENASEELRVLKEQFKLMQAKIEELEQKVAKQNTATISPAPVAVRAAAPKWLPEIGVVADTVLTLDSKKTDADGANRLSLRELELVLGSNVDPYSRLDATISFSDTENPSLEEAYLTRFDLPFETTARIGKFKPKVGKMLGVHRDGLDTVDEPLVIQRYFGPEGMNKAGIDLTKTLDLPLPITQQVVVGILEGGHDGEDALFGDIRRRPIIYTHLKNYANFGEDTGGELGFSYMTGSRDADSSFEVRVLASDLTVIHNFNANQTLKLQSEVFNVNRKETQGLDGNIWGWYNLVDVRVAPQWALGFRYDWVQPIDNPIENPNKEEIGYTGYLTFYQSEFARWRTQFTHMELTTGKDDNTFYLQGTFAIGEHKHKLQ